MVAAKHGVASIYLPHLFLRLELFVPDPFRLAMLIPSMGSGASKNGSGVKLGLKAADWLPNAPLSSKIFHCNSIVPPFYARAKRKNG
jgi:hypothetical protein